MRGQAGMEERLNARSAFGSAQTHKDVGNQVYLMWHRREIMKKRTEQELIKDILTAVQHDSPYGELKSILRTEFSLMQEEYEVQLQTKDEINQERKEACELLKMASELHKEAYESQLQAKDQEIIRCVNKINRLKSKLLHQKWHAIEFRHLFLSKRTSKNKKLLAAKHKRLEQ